MRVVIVGRDLDVIEPLVGKLTEEGFSVTVVENSSGVLSILKKLSINFLVAEAPLLVDQNMGRDIVKLAPLIRLIGFSARPTLTGLIDGIAEGLLDYFPRSPEYFDEVVKIIKSERRRITRWQHVLLTAGQAGAEGE